MLEYAQITNILRKPEYFKSINVPFVVLRKYIILFHNLTILYTMKTFIQPVCDSETIALHSECERYMYRMQHLLSVKIFPSWSMFFQWGFLNFLLLKIHWCNAEIMIHGIAGFIKIAFSTNQEFSLYQELKDESNF